MWDATMICLTKLECIYGWLSLAGGGLWITKGIKLALLLSTVAIQIKLAKIIRRFFGCGQSRCWGTGHTAGNTENARVASVNLVSLDDLVKCVTWMPNVILSTFRI